MENNQENQPPAGFIRHFVAFFAGIFKAIRDSFVKASSGKESLFNLICWQVLICLFSAMIFEPKILPLFGFSITAIIFSFCASSLFIWHIYAIRKCSPKKPKLSKEEQRVLKIQQEQERPKKMMRKLLLQEPIFNIQTGSAMIAIDLYFVVSYIHKIASIIRAI